MGYRSLLIFLIGIILVDVNSAQTHVTIEQTNGYQDTWTNINKTCSLVGVGLKGNTWESRVVVDNINDIKGTGWISAHVEHQGTLQFLGCEYGTVRAGTPSLEVAHDRIPQCIYFCKSSDILLHRNHCYCTSNVHLYNSNCLASRCGNNEPMFCGRSETALSKCMCHYRRYFWPNIRNNLMDGSCENGELNCTLKAQYSFFQPIPTWHVICRKNHVQCDFNWNGYVISEEFYWGSSSSAIGNQDYCVAIRRDISSQILILKTLPCSSEQTGICIRGPRISTTPKTTQTSSVILPTTGRYEQHAFEMTSHKVSEHTTNDLVSHHQSTIDYDTFIPPDTNTLPDTANLPDTNTPKLDITTMSNKSESTTNIDGLTSAKSSLSSSKSMKNDKTNILRSILGGLGTFMVLVIFGVVIILILKKRRRKADARSQPSQELNSFSTRKQNQIYINCVTEDQGGRQRNFGVDTGACDSLKIGRTYPKNTAHDLYDHTSEAGDNMYGRLNQDGRGNVSPENADTYDHCRSVAQVNGDTYDSFQTGVGLEDCSVDYYDHTHVGKEYGYLEKGGNRKELVYDIYDHSRDNVHSNGGTYDSFQKGHDREDACYDHTGVSAGYGYLQKGSKVTVLGDNDYDTMNVVKGDL